MRERNTKVDTVEIKTELENIYNNVHFENYNDIFEFINKETKIRNGNAYAVLQPSYADGEYSEYSSLTEYNKRLEAMLDKINVIDTSKIIIQRLDICFDLSEKYEEMYILGRVVLNLVMAYKKDLKFKNTLTTDDASGIQTYLKIKNDSLEVVWYDKENQSNGRHKYNSRLEFRFKRRRRKIGEEKEILKDLSNILNGIKDKKLLSNFESKTAQRIIDTVKKNESDLINHLKDNRYLLISKNALKLAYKGIYTKKTDKQFENWYKNLGKRHGLKACRWSEIERFIDDLRKSFKIFIKN